eukprot:TRINITY_DN13535_c0_g1_i1.p1 TRINITY_DN13535_c0_g1~~TRINITY_DN13535_c0_g1_i1.p1  ORF type:complete len:170 (-),score=22.65 TRINITY_DN13535_c0_g1_i1:113-622(-)
MEQPSIHVLTPGLVLIRNALSSEQQSWLSNLAIQLASSDPTGGFWVDLPDGQRVLNSGKHRGRIYDALSKFPQSEIVKQLCLNLLSKAQQKDQKMPSSDPTHLLLLYYANDDGMYWHRDSDKNDGSNDHPVISISLGNSCDFGYKLIGRQPQEIRLNSGDCLLFGGPQR